MKSHTSEKGLESLIVAAMPGQPLSPEGSLLAPPESEGAGVSEVDERLAAYGAGWLLGDAKDYDHEYAVDLVQLRAFVSATQPNLFAALGFEQVSPTRQTFLAWP